MKHLFVFALLLMFALPVAAEQTLSPIDVEAIPFDNSAAELNTESLLEIIEPQAGDAVAVPQKEKAGLPQFDTSTFSSQIFWLAITFVILYFYFAKAALPKLSQTMEKRRATIQSDLEQADKISIDVDKTLAEYEAAMQKAHTDSRTIITDAEAHLRAQADTQNNEFKEKSAQSIADLEAQAEKAKAKIKDDLSAIATDIASDIIGKITPLSVKDADIEKAVANSMGTNSAPQTKKKAA